MKINSNIGSLQAIRMLGATSKALSRALERLATGRRINRAGDDAAGLAVGTGIDSQRRGMLQVIRNLNDSKGFLNVADGALAEQMSLVQRMRELAMQASNGTLGLRDREYLDSEMQQLFKEFHRLTEQTNFNGTNLLDGSFTTTALQAGVRKGEQIQFNVKSTDASDIFKRARATGSFDARSTTSSAAGTLDVHTGDFNGDGIKDVASLSTGGLQVRMGNGDGTFGSSPSFTAGTTLATDLNVADINDDGYDDIIVADRSAGSVKVWQSTGSGTFVQSATINVNAAIGLNPANVEIGDINGDGHLDIVTGLQGGPPGVATILGNGNGTFQVATATPAGPQGAFNLDVALADMNGDGSLDIIASERAPGVVHVQLNNGNGTFQSSLVTFVDDWADSIEIADLNEDGVQDLVVYGTNFNYMRSFMGTGLGTFHSESTFAMEADAPAHFNGGVRLADLNDDGHIDMIYNPIADDTFYARFGNGDGTFSSATSFASGSNMRNFWLDDLNNDGSLDLIDADATDNQIGVRLNAVKIMDETMNLNLRTQSSAQRVLSTLDYARDALAERRAYIGALANRLDLAEGFSLQFVENLAGAQSQVMDADIALETAELTRQQILQQSGVAVLGQVNLQLQLVLALLDDGN